MTTDEPIAKLLAQITADAPQMQGLVIGYVRKDGNAAVRWTPMSTAMLSHLARILEIKIDRQYMDSMMPAPTQGVRPAPGNDSPKAAAKASPARRMAEREKSRNRKKQG
jgi:hypothetical protein